MFRFRVAEASFWAAAFVLNGPPIFLPVVPWRTLKPLPDLVFATRAPLLFVNAINAPIRVRCPHSRGIGASEKSVPHGRSWHISARNFKGI